MPRKIFLSFLGISSYEPVSYWITRSAENAPLEKYVQKTILNHLAPTFSADDQAYIFLTDEARAANWENDGHYDRKEKTVIPNIGLAQQIKQAAYAFGVNPVDVDGESEPEAIWATFERVFDCIQPNDEVYLDITHSWRYLPMLDMPFPQIPPEADTDGVRQIVEEYEGRIRKLAAEHSGLTVAAIGKCGESAFYIPSPTSPCTFPWPTSAKLNPIPKG